MTTATSRRASWVLALAGILAAGAASAEELWTEDAKEAMAQAAKEKKDLLINFTGSDWCGWCMRLDREVFSQPAFQTQAAKWFVFLKLDFPRGRQLPDETKRQNAQWAAKCGIEGYPTIILADAEGKPYAKTGYQPGGPRAYLKHLAELRRGRPKPVEPPPEPPKAEEKSEDTKPALPVDTTDQKCRSLLSLARNYLKNGVKDKARECLDKLLETYPSTKWAAEAKKLKEGL
jgi:thioredoxin-related protein